MSEGERKGKKERKDGGDLKKARQRYLGDCLYKAKASSLICASPQTVYPSSEMRASLSILNCLKWVFKETLSLKGLLLFHKSVKKLNNCIRIVLHNYYNLK